MTKPTELVPEALPKRNTSTVGGTVVGPGAGGAGGGAAGEVPIGNGDGTATWGPITADIVEYDPTASGLAATDVQAALDELAGSGGAGGGMVPYLIEAGETFTVPIKKQALKAMSITVDAGGSLVVDGFLLEVA